MKKQQIVKKLIKLKTTTICSIILSLCSPLLYASPHPELFELDGNAKHDAGGNNLPDDWQSLITSGHAIATTGDGVTKPNIPDPHPLSIFTQGGSKDINN